MEQRGGADELYRQIDMFVTSHTPAGYLEADGHDYETGRMEQEKDERRLR